MSWLKYRLWCAYSFHTRHICVTDEYDDTNPRYETNEVWLHVMPCHGQKKNFQLSVMIATTTDDIQV